MLSLTVPDLLALATTAVVVAIWRRQFVSDARKAFDAGETG